MIDEPLDAPAKILFVNPGNKLFAVAHLAAQPASHEPTEHRKDTPLVAAKDHRRAQRNFADRRTGVAPVSGFGSWRQARRLSYALRRMIRKELTLPGRRDLYGKLILRLACPANFA